MTTFASFASLWLLPRLPQFHREHPEIDIRISAGDRLADSDDPADPEKQMGLGALEPRRWIYLDYTHQQIQAALAGQGVALARRALAGNLLARSELVEPFGSAGRIESPFGYWLLRWPRRTPRPEVAAFEGWPLAQAAETRRVMEPAASAPPARNPDATIAPVVPAARLQGRRSGIGSLPG